MVIGVNCGHTVNGAGYGAVGIIKESEHTRLVGQALMDLLRAAGIEVIDCTIDSANSQNEYLAAAVELANKQELDWFISIHFNASSAHTGHGVEVYTYEGRPYQDALDVCSGIAALGFTNRGVKAGTGLYVIRKTKAKAMLIECCFCDNEEDVALYNAVGAQGIAKAICNAILPYAEDQNMGTPIMGNSKATAEQLNALLLAKNPQATGYLHLAEIFLEEGVKEGVRGDGAFCQALIETGCFKFGGDVQPDQHNYAGLGATGGVPGLSFQDDRTGIRAQIQHLKGYATTSPLIQECVDPRYKYVSKGCAPTFEQLSGKWAVPGYSGYASLEAAWAAKDSYGDHIVQLLDLAVGKEVAPMQPDNTDRDETAPEGMLYVVQVGAYKSLNNAKTLQDRLKKTGIISEVNLYKIETSNIK
ncbi:MAG: N-acetylmuramoyl-L-alanine amidase [Lachnospiraceae bacterium]|nr:N-acetylmuramoyl-L-alanine amidase [Lachnospiraceae bacterium]MBP3477605.1 N-acetylmuramoyl-L-alanine amidase [Lachnospiraceae bacterium]